MKLQSPPSIDRRAKLYKSIIFQLIVLFFQLVLYILKQSFTWMSMKVVDIYLDASRLGKYSALFTTTTVNNC